MKCIPDETNNRLDTEEEKIDELEDTAMVASKNETQREEKTEKVNRTSVHCGIASSGLI